VSPSEAECSGAEMDRHQAIWLTILTVVWSSLVNQDVFLGVAQAKDQKVIVVSDKEGLYYKTKDDVIILNSKNMKDRVYDKNMVWVIEFYNSWCGHCIHFAPTWKQFASDLKGQY
jgi:thiol-disulfide isomerase/thioredoxin